MSRNAAALKSSATRKPVRSLRPVPSPQRYKELPQLAGRVRGLKEMALTLLKEAQSLERDALTAEMVGPQGLGPLQLENGIKLDEAVRQFESCLIRQALLITDGNQARASRLLGIKPTTLNYKIKLYHL
jgi:DNA-binding NtrC family response regulator